MLGSDLKYSPDLSFFERLYITLFGAPISGLRIRLRRVLPHVVCKEGKILDAGCGRGGFSYEIAKQNSDVKIVAVDIDEERLDLNRVIAEKAGFSNIVFMKKNIENLDFHEEFELVVSVDNLEHLEDDVSGIKGLYRSLKKGGRLVLHVPGYERRWFFFKFQENFDVPGHFRPGYYKGEIKNKLESAGFHVDDVHYTFGYLETIANNISYFITGAEAKNKIIIALVFPVLNFIAWLGLYSKPKKGAGVLALCHKPDRIK